MDIPDFSFKSGPGLTRMNETEPAEKTPDAFLRTHEKLLAQLANIMRSEGDSAMTKLRHSTTFCLVVWLAVFAANCRAQERAPILGKIAKAYGSVSYGHIEAIRYTWNEEVPGVFKLSHTWEWEPKTGKISYQGKAKEAKPANVTYKSFEVGNQSDALKNEVEAAFVNDNYWLLFPFHAYWDTSATVTDKGIKALPVGIGKAELVSVKYPAQAGGRAPGDTWDLYVGKDYRIQQLVYHRGSPKKPSIVVATWSGYKKAGPLLISTEHRGDADGKPLHIFFTDVSVKLTGSNRWIKAQ